jgi:hypothetical protein
LPAMAATMRADSQVLMTAARTDAQREPGSSSWQVGSSRSGVSLKLLERFACGCAGDGGWFGVQGKKGAFPCRGMPLRRHGAVRREFPAPPRGAQCGEPHNRRATPQCAPKQPAAPVHSYANRSKLLLFADQTTAPPVSSFSLTGLIKSSRFTPSHIATAAATKTDE